ncbi:hypothetical protein HORIV_27880 [Vreelandella olivaria]|uniref:MucB/RseB N-terminal domain-containing protein n=1 Tax=Vreelandella olivaria TaxID=390919 RepID=A0ABM7GIF4_9GAMM|nr:hypothetical protein HORIV_27880 [Halomonas olivaria]
MRNIRVPRRLKGTWALAFLVGTLSLQAHAENADSPTETTPSEASARSGDSDGYECAMEEAEAQPRNATEWLERGLWASHCYAFQARAVAIDSVDVRTLALSHRIKDGIRQQVVQYLDGPSVSIERRSPVGRLAWTEGHGNGELPSPARWAAHLEKYYAIELEDNARVADREAIKLVLNPATSGAIHMSGGWMGIPDCCLNMCSVTIKAGSLKPFKLPSFSLLKNILAASGRLPYRYRQYTLARHLVARWLRCTTRHFRRR